MKTRHPYHRIAMGVAGALLCLGAPTGQAAVTASGGYGFDPGGMLPLDVPNLDLPGSMLWVGAGSDGSFAAGAGSQVDLRAIGLGTGGRTGLLTLDGAGTTLRLHGDGNATRLEVGNSGTGSLVVSGGALLDGRADAAPCLTGSRWCTTFVGNAAGSTGSLAVTGAGSEARLMGAFIVANINVNNGFGTPGATTRGNVQVTQGGLLRTEGLSAGVSWQGPDNTGAERSQATIAVHGAGSTWRVDPGSVTGSPAFAEFASGSAATALLSVVAGGLLEVQGAQGSGAQLVLGRGGVFTGTVSGTGSLLRLAGDTQSSALHIGEGGTAQLTVSDGGVIAGGRYVQVGFLGGSGALILNGGTADFGGGFAQVGSQGSGRLEVLAGSSFSALQLNVASGAPSTARALGEVVLDGAGSVMTLGGVDMHRLSMGSAGLGVLTVSGGALLDAAGDATACNGKWCGALIASNAGDEATLTVTGAGSRARFLSGFNVGQASVTAPPATDWTAGLPGGTSRAQVNVLAGGRLETGAVSLATGSSGPAATGSESVVSLVRVKGANSVWQVSGANGSAASFSSGLGAAANTLSDIQISDGGQLLLSADGGTPALLQLGASGGVHRMTISGAGSRLAYGATNNAGLWIGRNGATASLVISGGGAISGINRLQVGNSGAMGSVSVTGSGSRIDYGNAFADLYVGRQGGAGSASFVQGAVVSLNAALPRLYVGTGDGVAGTVGSLRLDGAGSLLSLVSPQSPAGTFDLPQANIGWGGSATVEVTGGAQLQLEGRGLSTPGQVAQTRATIGQATNGLNGTGTVNVGGAGSRLRVAGTDAVLYVGRGVGGTGTLNLTAGAAVQTTLLDVGLQGGVGSLQASGATLELTGQHGGATIGATLGIGLGTGSLGSVRLAGGSSLSILNSGDQGALLLIGGANSAPGGSGSLVVRASSVQLSGQAGVTAAVVGYNGSGVASLENGSTLDAGTTGSLIAGWKPGSTGALSLSGGSSATAAYVGVGASLEGDGGVATLIVNDTSTLTATTIEIGARGYVGGTGTLIGSVVNRGILSPGNSPGTLHVQGSFENQAGGRLVLEIESDGHGGFLTDQLVFDDGRAVTLAGMQVEFRFLGSTDPNAFQASGGFGIDTFLRQGATGLDPTVLGGASYTATSQAFQFTSFSFSPTTGAVFQAQAVPEPGSWMLLAAGLGLGAAWRRRGARDCG